MEPKFEFKQRVTTVAVPNPPTDWQTPGERKFGVSGNISKISNAHGLCYQVSHDDGSFGYYEEHELRPTKKRPFYVFDRVEGTQAVWETAQDGLIAVTEMTDKQLGHARFVVASGGANPYKHEECSVPFRETQCKKCDSFIAFRTFWILVFDAELSKRGLL